MLLPNVVTHTRPNRKTDDFFPTDDLDFQSNISELLEMEILSNRTKARIKRGINQIMSGIDTLDGLAYRPPHHEGHPTRQSEIGVDLYECYILEPIDNALAILALLSQK